MNRAVVVALTVLAVWITGLRVAAAETRLYVLAIGNNALPADAAGENLSTLRYADDDAAAFFTFWRDLAVEAELLTALDAASQKRYPDLARIARNPTLAEVGRTVARWSPRLKADTDAGHDPVVVFFFSGHGTRSGEASLAFQDGPMTQRALYDEVIAMLPARHVHLLVDACFAEAIVRPRDAEAQSVDLSPREVRDFTERTTLARFPHVGAVVATSTTQRAFEWDAIERGVFTQEVLSGLRGGADVNRDGRVEYSELYAFLVAANREIGDPRARLSVIAQPPRNDVRAPIVDLSLLRRGATLNGPTSTGRFYVEDEFGNRLVDVHAEPGFRFALRVPPGRLYVRASDREARLEARTGESVSLDALSYGASGLRGRGAIEDAMARGLFAEPFGPRYYRAFVDGHDELIAVPFASNDTPAPPTKSGARTAGWLTLGGAGVLVATTAVFAGLTLGAHNDYAHTSLEREATDARGRFETFRTLSFVGAAAALVAGGVGASLLLSGSNAAPKTAVGLRPAVGGASLAW